MENVRLRTCPSATGDARQSNSYHGTRSSIRGIQVSAPRSWYSDVHASSFRSDHHFGLSLPNPPRLHVLEVFSDTQMLAPTTRFKNLERNNHAPASPGDLACKAWSGMCSLALYRGRPPIGHAVAQADGTRFPVWNCNWSWVSSFVGSCMVHSLVQKVSLIRHSGLLSMY